MSNKLYVFGILWVVMMAFQNCGNVKFGNSKLSGDVQAASVGSLGTSSSDTSSSNSSASASSSSSSSGHAGSCNGGDLDKPDDVDEGGAGDLVACILVDHGKSEKLGLVGGKLAGVDAVSSSICMSRSACLNLVSAKFDVVGAYSRGYCENNPHVERLTDAQIAALLL